MLLRPDPLRLARACSEAVEESADVVTATAASRTWTGPVVLGATVMVLTQLVMVAIMTMTPIHMQHHGHSVGAAGFVIAVHVAGMYLPSLLSGALVDRFGAGLVGVAAAVTSADLLRPGLTTRATAEPEPGPRHRHNRQALRGDRHPESPPHRRLPTQLLGQPIQQPGRHLRLPTDHADRLVAGQQQTEVLLNVLRWQDATQRPPSTRSAPLPRTPCLAVRWHVAD
ncbi:hypothetical protein ACFWPH_33350 [Nocardia sp. NPDC058499]|uniref:hypothetical protein n=1 Tax=Nocardia sp. NPDC058499 TaxID=3346530 RepID=UPI003662531E